MENDQSPTLGDLLKESRAKAGLSLGEVAEELKVTSVIVGYWERDHRIPLHRHLKRMANLYRWSDTKLGRAFRAAETEAA